MSNGQKVITAYFAVTYWLPMAGNILFQEHIVSSYKIYPLTLYSIMLILGVYVLFLALSASKIPLLPSLDISFLRLIVRWAGRFYPRFRLPIGLIAIALAAVNFSAGLISYRYSAKGISEVNSPFLLFSIILNVIVTVDLFYFMFVRPNKVIKAFTRRYVENIFLSVALVISANGIAGLFQALIALFYSLFPRIFKRLIFVQKNRRYLNEVVLTIASLPVFLFIFAASRYYGDIIKMSSYVDIITLLINKDVMIDIIKTYNSPLKDFFYYMIERLSIYYYSLLFTVESSIDQVNYGAVSVLAFPLQSFLFRAYYLLGGLFQVAKPEVGSISQLNYKLLTLDQITDREGSSPGLIASFNYIFIFPLNVIFCALYLRWVSKRITVLLKQHGSETLSVFGILLVLQFLAGVFQSPFDFLIVIDENVISVVLLFALFVNSELTPCRCNTKF